MSCKETFKQLFLKCDIFSTSEFLRYNDEPQYRTYTGAFCSVVTVVAFCGVFMSVMISTLAKTEIIWSLNTMDVGADEFQVSTSIQGKNKFMFAVSLSGSDLNNNTQRMFDVNFIMRTKYNTITQPDHFVSLQKCTPQHWNVNEQFLRIYQRMEFDKMLCPPIGLQIPMQGKFSSQIFKYAQIRIVKCTTSNDPTKTCANETQLQNKIFYYNLYMMNTLINPQSPDYISYYLEDRNYIQFTTSFSSLINLFISNYEITTDQSITPITQQREQSGSLINNLGQVIPRQVDPGSRTYASIVLRRASTKIIASRSFKRVDDTLSYIGGLFGFLLIFLLFMKEYTEYSYEIDASSHLYYQDHQKPIKSHSFNFFIFLGYMIFLLLDTVGLKPNWKTMESLEECREEIQKQLDVKFLFERINFIEKSLSTLFNEDQNHLLHLVRKPTLKQASKLRQNYQLRKVLMEKEDINERQLTENPLQNTAENIQMPNKMRMTNKVYSQCLGSNKETIYIDQIKRKNQSPLQKIKGHLKLLRRNTFEGDQVSKKIIEDLDPNIIKMIYQNKFEEQSIANQAIRQGSISKIEISHRKYEEEAQAESKISKNREGELTVKDQLEKNCTFEFVN